MTLKYPRFVRSDSLCSFCFAIQSLEALSLRDLELYQRHLIAHHGLHFASREEMA